MSRSRGYDAPINELDLLGDGGGGLGSFMFNYGPSGTPNNAPPTAFERGLTRADPSEFGMFTGVNNNELPPPGEDQLPSDGIEDTIFDILMDVMAGTQGTIEGLDPEAIDVLQGVLDGSSDEELREVAQEILEAGGWEEWLEQNVEYGDPGDQEPEGTPTDQPYENDPDSEVDNEYDPEFPDETDEDAGGGGGGSNEEEQGGDEEPDTSNDAEEPGGDEVVDINEDDTTTDIDDGADDLPDGTEDSIGDDDDEAGNYPFFRVENGQVYVVDMRTGELILADEWGDNLPSGWWEGYLGENPEDGDYNDNGTPIGDDDDIESSPEPQPEPESGPVKGDPIRQAPIPQPEPEPEPEPQPEPEPEPQPEPADPNGGYEEETPDNQGDETGSEDDDTTGGNGGGDSDGDGTGDGSGDGSGTGDGSGSGDGSGVGAGVAAGLAGMLTGGKPGGVLQSNYRVEYDAPKVQELIDMSNKNISARKALDGLLTMLKGKG